MVVRCSACRAATPFAEKCQWCGKPLPPGPPQEYIPAPLQAEMPEAFAAPSGDVVPAAYRPEPVKWVIALLSGLIVFWFAYSPEAGRAGMVAAALLSGGIAVAVSAAARSIGQGTMGTALSEIFDEPAEGRLWSLLATVCGLASVTLYPFLLGPVGIGLGYAARRFGAKQTGAAAMLLALCGAAAGVLIAARIGPVSLASR